MTSPVPNFVNTVATGGVSTQTFINVYLPRDPTPYDINYQVQKRWVNTESLQEFILLNFFTQSGTTLANWEKISSGSLTTEKLEGNSGGPVSPDGNLTIQVKGDGTSINVVGLPSSNSLTANVILPGTSNSLLLGNVSSISGIAPGTSGQLLQCNGLSSPPSWVNAPQTGLNWSQVNTTTQTIAVQSGYLANNASQVVFTLPSTATQFSIIFIQGYGAGGWKIAQNASQQIIYGSSQTTVGITGYLESTNQYDCIQLMAAVGGSSTVWIAQSSIGNLTVV